MPVAGEILSAMWNEPLTICSRFLRTCAYAKKKELPQEEAEKINNKRKELGPVVTSSTTFPTACILPACEPNREVTIQPKRHRSSSRAIKYRKGIKLSDSIRHRSSFSRKKKCTPKTKSSTIPKDKAEGEHDPQ